MKKRQSIFLALSVTLATTQALAFQPSGATWDTGAPVEYNLEPSGSDDIDDGSDLDAVRFAFDRWSCAGFTSLRFREAAEPGVKSDSLADGINSVFWDETNEFGLGPATLGVNIGNLGVRDSSVIVFNGFDHTWSTDDNTTNTDVESIAVHEIGHWLGLDHSCNGPNETDCLPAEESVMNPQYPGGLLRALNADDIDGVRSLYPSEDESRCEGPFRQGEFCAGDCECIEGLVCQPDVEGANVCSPLCSSENAICPGGFGCVLGAQDDEGVAEGVCVKANGEQFPAGAVCVNDGVCKDALCIALNTVGRSVCNVSCEGDGECGENELCVEGNCLLNPEKVGIECPNQFCGCSSTGDSGAKIPGILSAMALVALGVTRTKSRTRKTRT